MSTDAAVDPHWIDGCIMRAITRLDGSRQPEENSKLAVDLAKVANVLLPQVDLERVPWGARRGVASAIHRAQALLDGGGPDAGDVSGLREYCRSVGTELQRVQDAVNGYGPP